MEKDGHKLKSHFNYRGSQEWENKLSKNIEVGGTFCIFITSRKAADAVTVLNRIDNGGN